MQRAHYRFVSFLASFAVLSLGCGQKAEHPSTPVVDAADGGAPISEGAPKVTETNVQGSDDAGATSTTKTLFVRETLADCQGEGPMKCMQVRESEDAPWELFYSRIEGFDYEESYAYELRVEVLPNPRPRPGGSSLRYRLVEVVSKRKVDPAKSP